MVGGGMRPTAVRLRELLRPPVEPAIDLDAELRHFEPGLRMLCHAFCFLKERLQRAHFRLALGLFHRFRVQLHFRNSCYECVVERTRSFDAVHRHSVSQPFEYRQESLPNLSFECAFTDLVRQCINALHEFLKLVRCSCGFTRDQIEVAGAKGQFSQDYRVDRVLEVWPS